MDYKEIFGEELGTQIETVVTEKGVNLIVDNKDKPNYIPKARFDEVIGSKNELKSQVSELTSQLEGLKKSAKGNDELTKQIEELQGKNSEWEKKYQSEILENAVKFKALQEKARDISDLTKFIDMSKLEFGEDGAVKGLDEQINYLKENKSYLFESSQPQNNTPANPPSGGASNVLSEKEKYFELQKQAINNPNNKNLLLEVFKQKRKLKG